MRVLAQRVAGSLTVRLIALLTIALLPLGTIAVFQTYRIVAEAGELSKGEMLARTVEIAREQVELIIEAQGAAMALGATAAQLDSTGSVCSDIMRGFVDGNPQFVFAGFIDAAGTMRCANVGAPIDFSSGEAWLDFIEDPRPTVIFNESGEASGLSVLIVTVPVFDVDETLLGAASVSIPHSLVDAIMSSNIVGVDVAITDGSGTLLSISGGSLHEEIAGLDSFAPTSLDMTRDGTVVDISGDRAISVVPVRPFDLFLVGTWANGASDITFSPMDAAAPLFPVLMWLASLFVAIFAIQRLVLRHLRSLRVGMRSVSLDNAAEGQVTLNDPPQEIGEIGRSYNALLRRVSADATKLAEASDEKDLLLREVHHRVKNNLQLIASILNMQLRQIASPETESVLRRVQQRVMSLAAIHKLLYTDTKIGAIRVDTLLSEIVNITLNMGTVGAQGPKTATTLDAVELDPDRAVPLALLVTEAVTNALKYVGGADGSPGEIAISMKDQGDGRVVLQIQNSLAPVQSRGGEADSTGLGSKLIAAFVSQLDGESTITQDPEHYTFTVDFARDMHQAAVPRAA